MDHSVVTKLMRKKLSTYFTPSQLDVFLFTNVRSYQFSSSAISDCKGLVCRTNYYYVSSGTLNSTTGQYNCGRHGHS